MGDKKLPIAAIMSLYDLNYVQVQNIAGITTDAVYDAFMQQCPIYREDAEKICTWLSRLTGQTWNLNNTDIDLLEDYLILWVIRASLSPDDSTADEYNMVYAMSIDFAKFVSSDWLERRPHLPHHSFTPVPNGFTIGGIEILGYLPGPTSEVEGKHDDNKQASKQA